MRAWPLIAAFVLFGCGAARQYFEPTERVHGETLQGYPEALYDLVGPRGRFGEGKVWSRGAYRGPNNQTVVHASIQIHNLGAAPIALRGKDVRLDYVRTDDGMLQEVAPAENDDFAIPPASIRELRFHFVMPSGTSPGEVEAFRLRWSVTHGDQSFAELTPFVAERTRYGGGYGYGYAGMYGYHYYCDPFDPFCFQRGAYAPYPYYGPPAAIHSGSPDRLIVHPRR